MLQNEVMKVVYEGRPQDALQSILLIYAKEEKRYIIFITGGFDKEGMPVWINCRGIVISDQQGKAEYLVGVSE